MALDTLQFPYFKFNPTAWQNGNIQLLDRTLKGLFVDLLCLYWTRQGELSYRLAVSQLCPGQKELLDIIKKEGIIKVENGQIFIDFLDDQLAEMGRKSEKAKRAINKRWSQKKALDNQEVNTDVLQTNYERNTTKTKTKTNTKTNTKTKTKNINAKKPGFSFGKSLRALGVKELLVNDFLKNRKLKRLANTETAFRNLKIELEKIEMPVNQIMEIVVANGWASFKASWDLKKEKKASGGKKRKKPASVIIREVKAGTYKSEYYD